MDAKMLAYLTARIVLGALADEPGKLVKVCRTLGRAVESEATAPATAEEHWSQEERHRVGAILIELFHRAAGLVVVEQVRIRDGKTDNVVRLTEIARAWIEATNAQRELLCPRYLPCVIPPRPWTGLRGGGYYTDHLFRPLPLVKKHSVRHLKGVALGKVLAAVNTIQATPWRVNRRVLEVVRPFWDEGLSAAGLPAREPTPLPPKPEDIATNEQARKTWSRAAARVHEENAKTLSERLQVAQALYVADLLQDDAAIYFPYQLDFRGRVYAVPRGLQPQGSDLERGLLTFAQGKRLGTQEAADWLAFHGANLWGLDKMGFDHRLSWHPFAEDDVKAVARDALAHRWWMEAEKPWQFLAWCFEWAGYLEQGEEFVSHLPVMVDGSCNGLQHYAAMLRDPVGGAAVNLLPPGDGAYDEPADIYQAVADLVTGKLEQSSDPLAKSWLDIGIVDRKVTKQPVMTLVYGSTQYACRKHVQEVVRKKWANGATNPFSPDEVREAITFLAKIVRSSIGEVVVAALPAMDWLRKVTALVVDEGHDPTWTAPSGFKVRQRYQKKDVRRVRTKLYGEVIFETDLAHDTGTPNRSKHRNSLPPHFIHSLDAATLVETVKLAAVPGGRITCYSMIHDAFGTHAADMEALGHALRHAFVGIYLRHDVLQEFLDAILPLIPEDRRGDVPPLPSRGSLDITAVLRSPYFFH
jgi:DNA-directed RNA polymerase